MNILAKDQNFKKLFGSDEHINILTRFLSSALNIPYKKLKGKVTLVKKELDEKTGVVSQTVDVLIELPGRKIQIEMNPVAHSWLHIRNFTYLSRIFQSGLPNSKVYDKVDECIQINFNGFEDDGEYIDVYEMMTSYGKKYKINFKIIEINIPKCVEKWYNGTNEAIVKWANIFMAENLEEIEELVGDLMTKEEKKELMDTVKIIKKGDPLWEAMEEDRIYYENTVRHEIYQDGLKEGRESGLKEGQESEQLKIAKNLKDLGVDMNTISKSTGLSIEKLEKL